MSRWKMRCNRSRRSWSDWNRCSSTGGYGTVGKEVGAKSNRSSSHYWFVIGNRFRPCSCIRRFGTIEAIETRIGILRQRRQCDPVILADKVVSHRGRWWSRRWSIGSRTGSISYTAQFGRTNRHRPGNFDFNAIASTGRDRFIGRDTPSGRFIGPPTDRTKQPARVLNPSGWR